jgi:hypothetical protein
MSESPVVIEESVDSIPQGWERRCHVLYKVNVTGRYHRRRQRFFDLLDKGTKAATVLLGASLFGDLLKQNLPAVAAAISSLGLMALVFGYSDRKQAHKELAEAALNLAAKIEESPIELLTDTVAGQWAADFQRLNAKEPPALKTLVIICEWEQSTADGHPGNVKRPSWPLRLFADFA